MGFKKVKGFIGKVYDPDSVQLMKKHPCEDCYMCQMCSDERCELCLKSHNNSKRFRSLKQAFIKLTRN